MIDSTLVAAIAAELGAGVAKETLRRAGVWAVVQVIVFISVGIDELADGCVVECEDAGCQELRGFWRGLATGSGVDRHLRA